jgi:hypothetical protein
MAQKPTPRRQPERCPIRVKKCFEGLHGMSIRRRFTATIVVAVLTAAITSACVPFTVGGETAAESDPVVEPMMAEVVEEMVEAVMPPPEPPAAPTPAPTMSKAPAKAASALRPTSIATFLIGNTQGRGMPMRPVPIPTERGKVWPDGTAMKGLGGEQKAYGWTWAWVQDPDGSSGWMPNNFLIPAAGSPTDIGSAAVPTLVMAPAEPPVAFGATPTPASAQAPAAPAPAQAASTTLTPVPAGVLPMTAPALTPALAASPKADVPASAPAPAVAPVAEWALAFDRVEPLTQPTDLTDAGIPQARVATGVFQRVYFRVKNKQDKSATIPNGALTLTDDQGRTYTSDFQVRQIQANRASAEFGSTSVVPGATVALNIAFDVAPDATGLALHMQGGGSARMK